METPYHREMQNLLWLSLYNALPTNDLRAVKSLRNTSTCSQCHYQVKTILHCLRNCTPSSKIWKMLGFHTDHNFTTQIVLSELKNLLVLRLINTFMSQYYGCG